MKYKIVALCGKAGAGKDTILNKLCEENKSFNKIISCTTRPSRDYEKNGIDYYFLSNEQFLQKVASGEMLEASEFRGWFYGTSIESLKEDYINIGVFNPEGILNLIETSATINTQINILPIEIFSSDKERLIRQLNREKNPNCEEICRRFQTDNKDFLNFHTSIDIDLYAIENENKSLDIIVKEISKIIKKF
jgi:guanylate kinase